MSRRKLLWGTSGVLLAILLIVITTVFLEEIFDFVYSLSSHRDDTHQGKPLSHWREVLRADGEVGEVSQQTLAFFRPSSTTIPVLGILAKDPDPKIRWVAVTILGRVGWAREVVPILHGALKDPDVNVRFHAIVSLAGRRGNARKPEVLSSLAELVHDPDPVVAVAAELALWELDVPTALRARGWKKYSSSEYQFTAMFPGDPEKTERTFKDMNPYGPVVAHVFQAMLGTMVCMVTVHDFPEKFIEMTNEEERLNAMRSAVDSFFPAGKLVGDKQIEQFGHSGREFLIKSSIKGKTGWIRSRKFWAGRRLYVCTVVWTERFANPNAAEYFLSSLQLPDNKTPNPAEKK